MAKSKKETPTDAELEAFKKKALEEAEKGDAEEEEESDEEDSEEESDDKADEEEKDSDKEYEDELAKERERREKAEKALAEKAFKHREVKRKEEGEEKEEEEEKPLTASQLTKILAEERQATQKEILSSQIKEKAKALSTSDAEANLIYEIHKNRTFPSYLSLDEQLEEAYAIANRKKLMAQNEELRRSLRSRETKKKDGSGSYKELPKPGEPKLAAHDRAVMKEFAWDGKYFTKKLSTGKTLYKDWKTKKTWVK